MFAGSFVQFTIAISHILRGQAFEAYGHVRHAIENSGIAYLAKSEPKIVEFYRARNERGMSKNYSKRTLFPTTDPLTGVLNEMFTRASRHLHGNLYSNELSIIEEDSVDEGSRVLSSVTFGSHDRMSFEQLWEVCYFVLDAGYHVSHLYAATFELPNGNWHSKLEAFKEDIDKSDLGIQAVYNKDPSC